MLKLLLITFFISFHAFSSEKEILDIENHPQNQFPQITILNKNKSIAYYASTFTDENAIEYVKEDKLLAGEVPLSGYIFSKAFVESVRIPNTVANRKSYKEFLQVFDEGDSAKMVEFLLIINDRKRTAANDKELDFISKQIQKRQTDDIPESTPYFSTGYVEIKSPDHSNGRYFIKAGDITKANIKLSIDKTKIELLKAITVYSFQNVLTGLNFGNIEKGSQEDLLYSNLEKINASLCSTNCNEGSIKKLGSFAATVGKIVSFEVVGASEISDMDDFNKYIFAQQFCLLQNFSQACSNDDLTKEIKSVASDSIIDSLIKKHGNLKNLCSFVMK